MTLDASLLHRLTPLVIAQLDGDIAPGDADELERLICQNEEARQLYLSLIRESVSLRYWSGSTIDNPPTLSGPDDVEPVSPPLSATDRPIVALLDAAVPGTVGGFSSHWPVAYLVATVIVGIGLLVGSLVQVSPPAQIVAELPPATTGQALPEHSTESVGRITGMVDCEWSDSLPSPACGRGAGGEGALQLQSPVHLHDRFAFSSGLMEITYDTGAKIILQGPVTYEVESAAGGYLSVGKLTAKLEKTGKEVPSSKSSSFDIRHSSFVIGHSPGAGGEGGGNGLHPSSFILHPLFSVRTPTATVTDLGTEFGVEVSKSGGTSTHVFRGVVEVQPAAVGGKQGGQAVRLIENESAKVEKRSGGEGLIVHRGAADAAAFVRSEQFQKRAEEPKLKPFRRWQAYSEKLRRDPSLLAYYDFQRVPSSPAVLHNVAANGDKSLDGVIENAAWSTGRVFGKHALHFNGSADFVRVNLPQQVDDMTLAAWVYVEACFSDLNGLLMSSAWAKDGEIHWQLGSDGRAGFSVHDFSGRTPGYWSKPFMDQWRWCRWVHLASVYDHGAARVKFYVGGDATGEARIENHVPIAIGNARIGQWVGTREFGGRIDELAIFGRPLTADEVRKMFEAGKPDGAENGKRQP